MKRKLVYPAIFQTENVGGYSVSFPDLPGCYSQGDNLEEALDMARDAVGIYLSQLEADGKAFPVATELVKIAKEENETIVLVDMDLLAYKQRHDNRAVKKTLSIPGWLNTMAEREGVNFSGILQAALKERLRV